jgi:TorA maturation chaperone TorD
MSEMKVSFGDALGISSSLYGILASCFSGEPSRKIITRLKEELGALQHIKDGWDESEVWESVENIADTLKGLTLKEASRDYAGLFLGARKGSVCPSESSYLEETMYGPATLRVIEAYEKAGFVKETSFREPDDHVAVEFVFRFLSGLDLSERMDRYEPDFPTFAREMKEECDFIKDHLAVWIPLLAKRVESFAETHFYRAVASAAEALVKADLRLHAAILDSLE